MITVSCGTTNALKLRAVRRGFEMAGMNEIELHGASTSSGVRDQPVGFEEGYEGASNRAERSAAAVSNSDVAVGIENFIHRVALKEDRVLWWDVACVVLLNRRKDCLRKETVAYSEGIEFPLEAVMEAERRGFNSTTVGKIMSEKYGWDSADPHRSLTHDGKCREDFLAQSIATAVMMANINN